MEIQQQINSLYELARERENARLQFKDFDLTIDSRSFLEINDSSAFDSMEAVYAEFSRLDNKVKKQSAALFTSLSKGMQYGMTVHEKPLLLGELEGDWLVLKAKPVHTASNLEEDAASPTYRCDVERVKP
jgi:hypothetical protein